MLFTRPMVSDMRNGGLMQRSRAGTGMMMNLAPVVVATDAAMTMTVAQMAGGLVQYSSLSAGRAVTTPTAALILAAATDMDIGDSFSFIVSAVAAFAVTWTAGTGVTLTGRATTPASSWSIVTVVKTSATTVTWYVS
jgi:hypothetical protein